MEAKKAKEAKEAKEATEATEAKEVKENMQQLREHVTNSYLKTFRIHYTTSKAFEGPLKPRKSNETVCKLFAKRL